MTQPTLVEIMTALADQVRTQLGTVMPGVQVDPLLVPSPTPPHIDVYPADPFQEAMAYGDAENALDFIVRVRTNTPDHEGAQEELLALMDPRSNSSLAVAIEQDDTLGGKVSNATVVEGPSQYGIYADPIGTGSYLGFTLKVRVLP